VYFFQDAPLAALRWAERETERRQAADCAVLKVKVSLTNCVDFTDCGYWELLRRTHGFVAAASALKGVVMPTQVSPVAMYNPLLANKKLGFNHLDYTVVSKMLQLLKDDGRTVMAVRAALHEGPQVYESSWLHQQSHVAICVTDPAAIRTKPRLLDANAITRAYDHTSIKL
jgi:hypothetical protein